MTNFDWWASQVPAGLFMCCICFDGRPVDQAWVDEAGQRWDMCRECKDIEDRVLAARAEKGDTS